MTRITHNQKTIVGLRTRTNNADEMNSEVAKIGTLWQRYFGEIVPTLGATPPPSYGIYCNYESDAMGAFDVLVGAENLKTEGLETVTLQAGTYLCFEANGELPQAVIDTWGDIWHYFSQDDCPHKRAYDTDFEYYISQTEAKVYIGIL